SIVAPRFPDWMGLTQRGAKRLAGPSGMDTPPPAPIPILESCAKAGRDRPQQSIDEHKMMPASWRMKEGTMCGGPRGCSGRHNGFSAPKEGKQRGAQNGYLFEGKGRRQGRRLFIKYAEN